MSAGPKSGAGRRFLVSVSWRGPEVPILAALEKLIDEEILRVQNEPVADWELSKVQMQLRRQRAQQLYSTRSRANSLGHYAVYYNDPNLVNSIWRKYDAVTRADLQRVARLYFQRRQSDGGHDVAQGGGENQGRAVMER